MGSKITIVGAGSVGSTIAHILSLKPYVSELVMIDILKDKADGEIMDMAQGTGFRDPISMIAGDYEDAAGSDIVIVTSGVARRPGQTRIELTQTNVNILKSITPEIVKAAPNAIYIIVSNPVDIMTYVFTKISGLPENQILGSGTMLDSARLRCGLSEHLNIAQKNIHAYVFGEHGDTSFIPWSGAYVSGVSLDEYYETVEKMGKNVTKIDKDAMLEYVRTSGGQVIANKGATFYAVSVAVCKLVATILSSSDSVATVSSMMHGEYGIEEVCLSTLTLVGPKGVQGKIPMRMTKEEVEKLKASADALKAVIAQIEH
jgi:L-lactate dehydrogenase